MAAFVTFWHGRHALLAAISGRARHQLRCLHVSDERTARLYEAIIGGRGGKSKSSSDDAVLRAAAAAGLPMKRTSVSRLDGLTRHASHGVSSKNKASRPPPISPSLHPFTQ